MASLFSSFFHPERGYKAARNEVDKYYQQGQRFQQPYNQHGEEAYGGLHEAMQALLNPQALYDKFLSGYKESEAAKQAEGQAREHGLSAASSLGLNGSSPALQAIQAGTNNIASQDRENYLNNLFQKYLAGVGIGQNIYGIGANAASQQSQNAINTGNTQAGLAYGEQNAPGDLFGKLLGAGIGLGGAALGGAGFTPKFNTTGTYKFGGGA